MDNPLTTLTPDQLQPNDAYRLLTSLIAPRPIAWVSTISANGILNLAPFSFFNAVAGAPPTVMFSCGKRKGQPKDTLRNVQATGEFVLNIVDEALALMMNETSADWSTDVSEFEMAGLANAPSVDVRPPRVALAPAALEARVTQIVPVQGTDNTMVLGRILRYHVRVDLLRPNYLIDASKLQPVMRLGGNEYTTLGRVFMMERPKV